MFGRHRRKIVAALALSLAAAVALGAAATQAESAQPAVVIGTKNFTEEYVLGQLYKQALEAKGFKVSYKENIGSTEIIDTALTSGKINFYPEYTGVILAVVFHVDKPPQSARATYLEGKRLQEKRGFTLFAMTPFYDRDEIGVLASTAKKHGLKAIPDLKRVPKLSICAFPEFQTRFQGAVGLKQVYGISKYRFVPLAGISAYAALDAGKCLASNVFSTDPQLAGGKYVVLEDTKNVFGFQNVAPVVSLKLAKALGPKFRRAVDAVSAKLTLKAMIAMNKAVAIDKKTPKAVADAFLRANGLK